MSDTPNPGASARFDDDRRTVEGAARNEADSVRAQAGKAGETVKQEASNLASSAKQKAFEGVEQGKSAAASSLSDFTAAIRKASDELGERDQSMAAGLARQAASGLEQAADALNGQSVQDITRSVADFARRQPTAFLVGAALAGVALGRFVRASSDHAGPLGPDHSRSDRTNDDWRRETVGSSHGASSFSNRSPSQSSGASLHGGASATDSTLNRSGASGSTGTSGLSSTPSAASSSQADATGYRAPGASPQTSALNQPGVSGSTNTSGLSGTSSTNTGERS